MAPITSASALPKLMRLSVSPNTTARASAALAAAPFFFSMSAHLFLTAGQHSSHWHFIFIAIVIQISGKLIAVPVAFLLLIFGLVLPDLEVSLIGVSTLALIYGANIGSWAAAARLARLLYWSPNVIDLQRWHIDGKLDAVQFSREDPYNRGWAAFGRLVHRASGEAWDSQLEWDDELIISLLATKFVSLSEPELLWCDPGSSLSVDSLLGALERWNKGWRGQPGRWLRQWISFQPVADEPSATSEQSKSSQNRVVHHMTAPVLYEKTLRFVIVLFECIRRSELKAKCDQRKQLLHVLSIQRSGNMSWFYTHLRSCLDQRALSKTVGTAEPLAGEEIG